MREIDVDAARQPWHCHDQTYAYEALSAHESGLGTAEAETRLASIGPNRLDEVAGTSLTVRVLRQFQNALIYVLLVAAVITTVLGEWVDTVVILGVVIIQALIGVIQEGKAEKALNAIRQLLSHEAIVQRDGRTQTVPAEALVPGDVVMLQPGDRVPADLRLLRTRELSVDESILTGESQTVLKSVDPVVEAAPLAERFCMVYSGTLVTAGAASGLVVSTGPASEIGRISGMLDKVEPLATPLLKKVEQFARQIAVATVVLAIVTFLYGWLFQDYTAAEMFLVAVGLAVAAIPEGLPAILAITLAIGVQRMARRKAIIRQLPAVETLGAVSVICTDKTGTLTRNEMTVTDAVSRDAHFVIEGVGYEPVGDVLLTGQRVEAANQPVLKQLAQAALLCNDAALHRAEDGRWTLAGDPTEGALLSFAMKSGLETAHELHEHPRADAIPFESENRYMATLNHDHHGKAFVCVKGAPERLMELCDSERTESGVQPLDREFWTAQAHGLASDGKRVLALATTDPRPAKGQLDIEDLSTGLALVGLLGMVDPPRPDAVRAVASAQAAGIRVKMITGDHAGTAAAIGRSMNIGTGTEPVTGAMLETLDDGALSSLLAETDIFARTSPEHKLRLVTALQAQDRIVAMTGDGVNDAPALKRADVGIAMGLKGTEAAKQAARVVLADDNFASIVHAVEEGRIVYDNFRKAVLFVLPVSGGQALSILAAVAMGIMMPITPVQILWVNMVTAVTLALALAFEPAEPGIMKRQPRAPNAPLLTSFLVWRSLFVSVLMVAASFGLHLWYLDADFSLELSRTIAVNTLVLCEIMYLLSTRVIDAPALKWRSLTANAYVWYAIAALLALQLLFTYAPPFQHLFDTKPLAVIDWLRAGALALILFVLVELEKSLLRFKAKH
ncbi:cation-transporting P-type ATPase [Allohahella marinimesophila]|uniref:Cation-transporting P-type ATPase n=1 Tax=Allohahella marinimesophila TaxID=1054972 RepID=A0ABP7P389_9GAMM